MTVVTEDAVTTLADETGPVATARVVDLDAGRGRRGRAGRRRRRDARLPRPRQPPVPDLLRLRPGPRRGRRPADLPRPGRRRDRGHVASLWVPHAEHAESGDLLDGVERCGPGTTWAALDCVGGWSEDLAGRPCVLGRMTARVDALPVVGEPHVVVGRHLSTEGRKSFTASTLYDADGRVVATARHTWIQVDPAVFH